MNVGMKDGIDPRPLVVTAKNATAAVRQMAEIDRMSRNLSNPSNHLSDPLPALKPPLTAE